MNAMIEPQDPGFIERTYFLKVLHDHLFYDDYSKTVALRAEIEEIVKEKNAIATASLVKTERLEELKKSFDAYQARRRAVLKEFLASYPGRGEAFKYFADTMQLGTRNLKLPPALSWEEVRQAFESLPEAVGAISQKDQEKTISKLSKRLAELEKEIETLFPERYHGKNGTDLREVFVRYWVDLQGRCNAPCTPEGWALEDYGSELEKTAWKRLRLGDFINKNGREPYKP